MIVAILLAAAVNAAPIALDEALSLAARANPEVRIADLEARVAEARAAGVRTWLLPTVTASGAALWWNDSLEAVFIEGDPCASLDEVLRGFCEQMVGPYQEPILLRNARTQQVSLQARQPLTGLYGVSEGWRAGRAAVRAARADAEAVRAATAVEVVDAWFTALETRRMVDVARRGVKALEAHRTRSLAFHEVGLLGRNELLQIEVALSEARVNLLRAETGVGLAERRLALVAGSDEAALQPEDLDLGALPPLPEALPVPTALPTLTALAARREAALANRNRLRSDLLPQVGAIASWTRNWGLGTFSAEHEWYVGLGLEWEALDWGRHWYAAKEAGFQAEQAAVGLAAMERGARLQADAALVDARVARAAVETSRTTVDQAEENLRIVTARFDARVAPATDLLEAETLRSKAEADGLSATFDYLLAVARAQEALGMPVRPLEGIAGTR
ncbi:MAG: TolC family protein [Deltaproteobacteria bacterium]|nr:TolC family protein [Deltaproteobacteria bacterium]